MKKKFSISYALVFLVATLSLSNFFGADKFFAERNDSLGFIVSLSSFLLFAACLVYMAYRIYADEKSNSNLRVSFAPFEWVYAQSAKLATTKSVENTASKSLVNNMRGSNHG